MTLASRLRHFRERLRPDPADPPRVWLRREWMRVTGLSVGILAVWAFNVWLGTCGFARCPTPAEIRALHPSEGGRILDRSDRLIGRLAIVRRVNVRLADVPQHVQQAFVA